MTHRIAVIAGRRRRPRGRRRGAQGASTRSASTSSGRELAWGTDHFHEHGPMMPADALEQSARGSTRSCSARSADPSVPDHVTLWGLLLPLRQGLDLWANLRPARLLDGRAVAARRRARATSTCSSCARTPRASTRASAAARTRGSRSRSAIETTRVHARGRRARRRATPSSSRAAARRAHERDEVERLALRLRALGRGRRRGRGRASRTSASSACSSTRSRRAWCAPEQPRRRRRVEPLRRHPHRPRAPRCRAAWAWPRAPTSRPAAGTPGDLRAGARLGARHRRPGHREPDRRDLERRDDARPPRRARGGAARLLAALEAVCRDGPRTRDIGGTARTAEVGAAIARRRL